MVDPVTIMAGLALVKKSVDLCKSAVDTCNDISELSGSLNQLFHHHSEAERHAEAAKKRKAPSKLRQFLSQQTNSDEEDDLSVGAVAAEIIEKKNVDKAIWRLSMQVDRKWGNGTWKSIIEERNKRIRERIAADKLAKENALKQKEKDRLFWKKVMLELRNVVVVVIFGAAMVFFVMWAAQKGGNM